MESHVMVKCYNCKRLVWSESAQMHYVREDVSGGSIAEDFCPVCVDEIEARSRNAALASPAERPPVVVL